MVDDDRLAVEAHVLGRREVLVDRKSPQALAAARGLAGFERRQRRGHAPHDALVRDDVQRLERVGRRARERDVAAGVIRVQVRVDQKPDRPLRQLADLRHQRVRGRGRPGVHEQHAVLSDLDRDVSAGAEDGVHVLLHAQRLERGRLLGDDADIRGQCCEGDEQGSQ